MRTIPLTQGRVALVDDEDFEMLSHWRWCASGNGYASAYTGGGRSCPRFAYMHRMIMLPDPDQQIDHITGDRLDNRRCNLRLATFSEQSCNTGARKGETSRYKGVSLFRNGKWVAQIQHDHQYFYLGYYDSPVDAAHAYDVAAREHHGEFAYLNYPTVKS